MFGKECVSSRRAADACYAVSNCRRCARRVRRWLVSAGVALLLSAVPVSVPSAVQGWTKYVPSDGSYSVLMPTAPTVKYLEVRRPEGDVIATSYAMAQMRLMACAVTSFDEPWTLDRFGGLDAAFDFYRRGLLEKSKCSEVPGSRREIRLGAVPGLEFTGVSSDGHTRLMSRVYIDGRRTFLLMLVWQQPGAAPNADTFFGSFVIR